MKMDAEDVVPLDRGNDRTTMVGGCNYGLMFVLLGTKLVAVYEVNGGTVGYTSQKWGLRSYQVKIIPAHMRHFKT